MTSRVLLQRYGAYLVECGVDLLQGVIAAIDGEKDPRCLLLSFQLTQLVIQVYENTAPQVVLDTCSTPSPQV